VSGELLTAGVADVDFDDHRARFMLGDAEVGDYILDDPVKPYLHPLRTLRGRTVSLAKPFDHPHHKGLMYGLSADDVNWWEEHEVIGMRVGVQRVLSTEASAGGIRQHLLWSADDGTLETFREEREITCRWDGAGFVRWEWTSRLETLRDVRLTLSPWAHLPETGRPVSYHGLGLRFPRSFGVDAGAARWSAGPLEGADAVMGARPAEVAVSDRVDGEQDDGRVSVRIAQPTSGHGVFAMQQPFSYLSIGPTNLDPRVLAPREVIHEHYIIDVADGDLTAAQSGYAPTN
jgi:hypothetical protein